MIHFCSICDIKLENDSESKCAKCYQKEREPSEIDKFIGELFKKWDEGESEYNYTQFQWMKWALLKYKEKIEA